MARSHGSTCPFWDSLDLEVVMLCCFMQILHPYTNTDITDEMRALRTYLISEGFPSEMFRNLGDVQPTDEQLGMFSAFVDRCRDNALRVADWSGIHSFIEAEGPAFQAGFNIYVEHFGVAGFMEGLVDAD